MADDEKKMEVTLLTDAKVDTNKVGKRGETHMMPVGIATTFINNGLAVEGKQKVTVAADPKPVAPDAPKPKP